MKSVTGLFFSTTTTIASSQYFAALIASSVGSSSLKLREAKPISEALGPSLSSPNVRFQPSPEPVWFTTKPKLPANG